MITNHSPIGVLDSGVGGISVLRTLVRQLPHEDFIFYGDCANAPYGEKSDKEIVSLTSHCHDLLIENGAKAVVIACNTATSAAAAALRAAHPDEIIIGIEPAVKPAVDVSEKSHPVVLVLATAFTLHASKLHELISRFEGEADIHTLAAPGIVRLVEAGKADSDEMYDYLRNLMKDYVIAGNPTKDSIVTDSQCGKDSVIAGGQSGKDCVINGDQSGNESDSASAAAPHIRLDGIVLGCTHFPFAKNMIEKALGYQVAFYDGAEGTARECEHRLKEAGLLNTSQDEGHVTIITSGDRERSEALARALFEAD